MAKVRDIKPDRVLIDLGGKERELKYDLNAFAELEKRYGSVDDAMQAVQTGGMIGMRTVIWAGLIHDQAVLDETTGEPVRYLISPYAVGSWISPAMMPELSEKLAQAMSQGMPDPENMTDDVKRKLAEAGYEMTDSGLAQIVPTEDEKREAEKN